jgi:flagellar protein FlaG
MANMGIEAPALSVGGPQVPVNLSDAFSKGANGPTVAGEVSFDGRSQDGVVGSGSSSVVAPERIDQAVSQIADFVRGLGRSLAITVDERSGDFVVQVQNADTNEVIRQIPSDDIMRIAAAVEDRNSSLRLMGERGAGALLLDVQI